ncbi:MAG: recombination protein RecR [Chloroflexi bacterium]|nr:MAG: recombination protein RecR [Chloroflexota bacterium]RLC90026.1 MAG: recombination protein RecR [Chloroflexota bacterium]HEY67604.1 recombination protein RecR [Thermoflexia bacterium]
MQTAPASVTRLIEELAELPGIGRKTAARLTYFLLRDKSDLAGRLAEALRNLKERTRFCSVCYNVTEEDPCPICADPGRDHTIICVVEEPLDVLALEQAGVYKGVYHVLHGVLAPSEGMFVEDLRIGELVARVRGSDVEEVILATNPTSEGDWTASYLLTRLRPLGVRITRLGRGLPVGGDLEYADAVTLTRALEGREAI